MGSNNDDIIVLSDSDEGNEIGEFNILDQLFVDVDVVYKTLQKRHPGNTFTLDKNQIFEQLELRAYNKNRIALVAEHFSQSIPQTLIDLPVDHSVQPLNLTLKSPVDANFYNNGLETNSLMETNTAEQPANASVVNNVNGKAACVSLDPGPSTSVAFKRVSPLVDLPSTSFDVDNDVFNAPRFHLPVTNDHQPGLEPVPVTAEVPLTDEEIEKLLNDAQKVATVLPDCDFDDVCSRLKAKCGLFGRVSLVVDELMTINESVVVVPALPAVKDDAAGAAKRDLETSQTDLSPKKPKVNDEAGPSGAARFNLVDFMSSWEVPGPSNAIDDHPPVSEAAVNETEEAATQEKAEAAGGSDEDKDELQSMVQNLKETFPDADPDYLMEVVLSYGNVEAEFLAKVSGMLENPDYPKLKDRQEREKMELMKQTYKTRVYTPEEVLQWFEDPAQYFSDTSKPVTNVYRQHTTIQVYNDFPKLTLTSINLALSHNRWHYLPTYHDLLRLEAEERTLQKYKKRKVRVQTELPAVPDELFYKELAFRRIENEVKDYITNKEKTRLKKIEEARREGTFITCQCCFDDEILMEDVVDCGVGHWFCQECIRRGADVAAGQGQCHLDCMASNCQSKFPLEALRGVLKPSVFSNWLIRLQAEEVSKANIPDLVHCPHCNFAAIMPNPEDKVFRCLNPDCLKETCRLCKEPNHVPLRCEEIEKSDEIKMRTFVENKMTEALIRICPKCNRPFMKDVGCNMMRCVCGQNMCYVCRQPIKDYSHFGIGPNKCPQDVNTDELHRREVADGGSRAKEEFVAQHPEFANVKLKHDPTSANTVSPPKTHDVRRHREHEDSSDSSDDSTDSIDDSTDDDDDEDERMIGYDFNFPSDSDLTFSDEDLGPAAHFPVFFDDHSNLGSDNELVDDVVPYSDPEEELHSCSSEEAVPYAGLYSPTGPTFEEGEDNLVQSDPNEMSLSPPGSPLYPTNNNLVRPEDDPLDGHDFPVDNEELVFSDDSVNSYNNTETVSDDEEENEHVEVPEYDPYNLYSENDSDIEGVNVEHPEYDPYPIPSESDADHEDGPNLSDPEGDEENDEFQFGGVEPTDENVEDNFYYEDNTYEWVNEDPNSIEEWSSNEYDEVLSTGTEE